MRLSRDDETYGDSVSIETQRTILRSYAKENGFHVVDEYVDDGWSGTNFERPDFQRMMDDVEAGKINCIITKSARMCSSRSRSRSPADAECSGIRRRRSSQAFSNARIADGR